MFEKIVVVTRKTRLQELVERFNSRGQAKFYIEHAGGDFQTYVLEDDAYRASLDEMHASLDIGLKLHFIERGFVATYLFTEHDVIVTVGQDGLVANTAKYAGNQPIVAVNPDPVRFDGILLPFAPSEARAAVEQVVAGSAKVKEVTLAEASLNDGQRLLAFNDLFIGARTHVSARYRIEFNGASEPQSSSGVLVSTGAGSTGWLSSVFNMAAGVSKLAGATGGQGIRMAWDDRRLVFVVRESFLSKASRTDLVAGMLEPQHELVLESHMPAGGAIFSDGIEADYLAFNSGTIAKIRAAKQRARLVV